MLEDAIYVYSICEHLRGSVPHQEIMAKKEGKVPRGPQVDVVVKHTVKLRDLGENSVNNLDSQYTRPVRKRAASPSQVMW